MTPSGLNALFRIMPKAAGSAEKLAPIITRAVPTYSSAMNGTSFEVTFAMLFIPPIITIAVKTASMPPNSQPRVAKTLSLPPVTLTNCT